MRIFWFILGTLLSIVLLILFIAAFLPRTYRVERAVHIHAPYDLVWEHTVDFKHFQEWSPWSKLDRNMELKFSGEPMSVGAAYTWKGNEEAGSGRQEITYISKERVDIQLSFKEPFESEANTYYIFEQLDGSVEVIWGMEGRMPWPLNLMTFMLKKSIGHDYAEGLNNLRLRCENLATQLPVDDVDTDVTE
jgi:hypothetical protein